MQRKERKEQREREGYLRAHRRETEWLDFFVAAALKRKRERESVRRNSIRNWREADGATEQRGEVKEDFVAAADAWEICLTGRGAGDVHKNLGGGQADRLKASRTCGCKNCICPTSLYGARLALSVIVQSFVGHTFSLLHSVNKNQYKVDPTLY